MDVLEQRFLIGMERIGHEITSDKVKALQELDCGDLPVKYLMYLKVIQDVQPLTAGQLAEALQLTKPAVTAIMRRMEKDDCMERRTSPDDGRVMLLSLTPKGTSVADAYTQASLTFLRKVRQRLSEAEFLMFIELLERGAGIRP